MFELFLVVLFFLSNSLHSYSTFLLFLFTQMFLIASPFEQVLIAIIKPFVVLIKLVLFFGLSSGDFRQFAVALEEVCELLILNLRGLLQK